VGHLAVVLVANAPACDIGSDLRGGHDTTGRPAACGDVVDEHCRPCAVTWCRRRASSRRPGRKWRQPGTRSSASCNRPLSRPASRLAAAACPARPHGLERVRTAHMRGCPAGQESGVAALLLVAAVRSRAALWHSFISWSEMAVSALVGALPPASRRKCAVHVPTRPWKAWSVMVRLAITADL